MTDKPSNRERFLRWAAGNPLLKPLRKIMPEGLRGRIVAGIAGGGEGTIDLGGAQLKYELTDPYWRGYAKDIRRYEPELWSLIDRFVKPSTIFVDCGANIGLYPCAVSTIIRNPAQIIAIEPGDAVLKQLWRNYAVNNGSFTLIPHAVWNKSGETLIFNVDENHAGSSLVAGSNPGAKTRPIQVQTVSIDDIVEEAAAKTPEAKDVVIKLDVEGVETKALEGAMRTLENHNTMIIYEDHGKEPNSETTAHFLRQGLHVYYVDPAGGYRQIHDSEELRPIKTDPSKGYNFVACRAYCDYDKALHELSTPMVGAADVRHVNRIKKNIGSTTIGR